jgi:hypothetical protein
MIQIGTLEAVEFFLSLFIYELLQNSLRLYQVSNRRGKPLNFTEKLFSAFTSGRLATNSPTKCIVSYKNLDKCPSSCFNRPGLKIGIGARTPIQ